VAIGSAILALAPAIYWPMDDAGPTTAADLSGNGNPGLFLPGSALRAPGPEPGSYALASGQANAGVQIQGLNPIVASPFSQHVWFASNSMTTINNVLTYIGNSAGTGCGMVLSGSTVQFLFGGIGFQNTGYALAAGYWHQLVFVETFPAGNQTLFVDGVQRFNFFPSGAVPVPTAANPVLAQTPDPGLLAHAAFWNVALTPADVTALWAAGPGSVASPPLSGRPANDADVLGMETKLDAILASVRKSY